MATINIPLINLITKFQYLWNENDETVSFAPPSSPIVLPGYRNLDFTGPYLPIKLSLGNSQIIKDDGIDKDDYGNFYVSLENNLQSVTKRVQSITKESEGQPQNPFYFRYSKLQLQLEQGFSIVLSKIPPQTSIYDIFVTPTKLVNFPGRSVVQ